MSIRKKVFEKQVQPYLSRGSFHKKSQSTMGMASIDKTGTVGVPGTRLYQLAKKKSQDL